VGEAHPNDPLVGEVVAGRYRVVRLVGSGGMGKIYEVEHLRLKRSFAMKQLDREYAKLPEALARFDREADVVARLHHPHIVAVTDRETLEDGSPCIIMEYLQGRDLADRIARSGPLPWPFVARIADQTMAGLSAAHRSGVVHRDLKPSNIFIVDDGEGDWWVKLLDFGLSKVRDAGHFQTTTGDQMFGTPAYMAPEQASGRGAEIGPPADVWAMGVVLYQMATARLPFEGESPMATLYQICHESPEPLRPYRADAPDAFVRRGDAARERDPARRIASVDALRLGLRDALFGIAPGAFSEPLPTSEVTRTDVAIGAAPPAEPTIPTDAALAETPFAGAPPSAATAPAPQRSAPRGLTTRALVIAAVGVVVTLAVWGLARRGDEQPAVGIPPPRAPSPSPTAVAVPPAAPDAHTPEHIVVSISTPPLDARLELDGLPIEGTSVEVERLHANHVVTASAPGHVSKTVKVDERSPAQIAIELAPTKRKPHRRTRATHKRKRDERTPPPPLKP